MNDKSWQVQNFLLDESWWIKHVFGHFLCCYVRLPDGISMRLRGGFRLSEIGDHCRMEKCWIQVMVFKESAKVEVIAGKISPWLMFISCSHFQTSQFKAKLTSTDWSSASEVTTPEQHDTLACCRETAETMDGRRFHNLGRLLLHHLQKVIARILRRPC